MKKNILVIFLLFGIWRIALFAVAYLSTLIIPNFGARFPYFDFILIPTGLPSWIWGFGNFDGVHYLRIALNGYEAQFTQAFFPVYPLLLNVITLNHASFLNSFIITNVLFLLFLFAFYKLILLDHRSDIALKSIILLIVFPTAFYFGAIYSESLFFLLITLSILFFRKKQYLLAGFLGAISSATRIEGLLLVVLFIIEIICEFTKSHSVTEIKKSLISVILVPLGLIGYMIFLKINFNDPLYFLNSQPFFGAGRSNIPLVLLPQVIFRYIKMMIILPIFSLAYLTVVLEFLFTILPLGFVVLAIKKYRLSYLLFVLSGLLLPTLTGTLSSMPRYSLICYLLFPFLVLVSKRYFYIIVVLFAVMEMIFVGLFTRGYWVA